MSHEVTIHIPIIVRNNAFSNVLQNFIIKFYYISIRHSNKSYDYVAKFN